MRGGAAELLALPPDNLIAVMIADYRRERAELRACRSAPEPLLNQKAARLGAAEFRTYSSSCGTCRLHSLKAPAAPAAGRFCI